MAGHSSSSLERPPADPDAELIAFLAGRSAPCPRCAYDLRDVKIATCPECGEVLELTLASPRARFGWLVVAMVPGCFSGLVALIILYPSVMTIARKFAPGRGMPWPLVGADMFGLLSALSVWLMYRHRHRIMAWSTRGQMAFAATVWAVHIQAFVLLLVAMWYWH